ncbi:MAG: T9SS type A sorting domain-containing protein, partial [Bacteroidetes bacterium]|nr:T9SS type A sorting domain-containing protein [Bacteroidota bacterium]
LPTVTVGVTPAAAVCANTNVVFTATPTFGGTAPTYVWKVNGNVQGTNSAVFSSNALSNGDIVTVEMTSNETCVSQATVLSTPQTITVYALPAVPTISQTGNVLTSSAVTGNQWLQNGAPISGASSQVYTINATGYYAVQVTNSNGCSVQSDSVQFTYTGLEEIVLKDAVSIMPNPFVENVMVNIASKVKDLSQLNLTITNELGQLIFETNKVDYINKFDFGQRAAGVYYIHLHDSQQRQTFKVIKQN